MVHFHVWLPEGTIVDAVGLYPWHWNPVPYQHFMEWRNAGFEHCSTGALGWWFALDSPSKGIPLVFDWFLVYFETETKPPWSLWMWHTRLVLCLWIRRCYVKLGRTNTLTPMIFSIPVHILMYIYIRIYIYIHSCIYMYICIYIYTNLYIYIYIYICIYIYIYTCTRIYIYIYTLTHILVGGLEHLDYFYIYWE